MKYAVVGDEFIETDWHDTEEAAIAEYNQISDEPYGDDDHSVQAYNDEQIAEIEAYSEAHPQ